MVTAISLILLSLVLLIASAVFFIMSIAARISAGAGMCVCSLLMAGLSIMNIVDAVHYMVYGTSLGSVPY